MSASHKSAQVARIVLGLSAGVSVFALAYSHPAAAQQAAQADQPAALGAGGLEEIVVTARRKEEKAQTVPVSLLTFSNDALKEEEIDNVTMFGKLTPAFTPGAQNYTVNNHTWLRGVQGVLGYFNGVPTLSNYDAEMFFDVANVQILKGPQGTLFGIATNGGAIVSEPKKPTNDFEGFISGQIGNYNHSTIEGAVNVPIVEDKVLLRVAGIKTHTDGYVYDIARGIDLADVNYDMERAILTLRPTDNLSNEFYIGYFDNNSITNLNPAVYPIGLNPAAAIIGTFGLAAVQANEALAQQLGHYAIATDGATETQGMYYKVRQYNLIDTVVWDINDDTTLKNLLSYQQLTVASLGAPESPALGNIIEGGAANKLPNGTIVPYQVPGPNVQYSEELQLLGKVLDDKLSYTLGSFNQMTRVAAPHPAFQCETLSQLGALSCSGGPNSSGSTIGLYGSGTYDLGAIVDGLSFTGGYRYTWDRVYTENNAYTTAGVRVAASSGSLIEYSHAPAFSLSLDYQLNPTTMFYVSDNKGYSKGGLNSVAVAPVYQSFGPEKLNEVEVGVKTDNEIFGVKTRVNGAVYYGWYDNIQSTQYVFIAATPLLPTSYPQVTTNYATGYSEGADGEFTIIPDDSIQFHLDWAYNNTRFLTYPTFDTTKTPPQPASWAYLPVLYAPKNKFNASFTYHVPIGWMAEGESLGDLTFTPSFTWTSVSGHVQGGSGQGTSGNALTTFQWIPDISNLDMTVNWKDVMGRPGLDATFWITNVNNNWIAGNNSPGWEGLTGMAIMPDIPPRMMGVTVRYAFGP